MAQRTAYINKNDEQKTGMTLVEIIVVLALLTILAAALVANGWTARRRSKTAQAKSEMRLLGTAVQQYHNLFANDVDLVKRWPAEVEPNDTLSLAKCQGADAGKVRVPQEVIDAGLWNETVCSYLNYENWPTKSKIGATFDGGSGTNQFDKDHVVGISWYGLDNRVGGDDDWLLLIYGTEQNLTNLQSRGLVERQFGERILSE